jgi:hypothetical protein
MNMQKTCSEVCSCRFPYFMGMTVQDMESIGIKHGDSASQIYKTIRNAELPYNPPAKVSFNLSKAIEKHGFFEIGLFCQALLYRAKPKMIHNFENLLPQKQSQDLKLRTLVSFDSN